MAFLSNLEMGTGLWGRRCGKGVDQQFIVQGKWRWPGSLPIKKKYIARKPPPGTSCFLNNINTLISWLLGIQFPSLFKLCCILYLY